jgi:N-acetylglucosamine-6-sulfatase
LPLAVAVLGATAGLYLAQVGSSAAARPGGHSPGQSRPNIVLVMTDDQALAQMSAESMPRVDRLLGDGGTRFSHAYLTTPLCCPSRASLLTGQYGHNNGVLRNAYPLLKAKANVLPTWLRRAGYVTAHVGKFMNHYRLDDHPAAVAPGWDQWHTLFGRDEQAYYDYDLSVNGRRVHHGHKPRDYSPRVFSRAAVRMVRRYVPKRHPLFLDIDELAPHPGPGGEGTRCQGNPVPDPRDENRFENAPLPTPPSFNEADLSDKPSFVRSLPQLDSVQIRAITRRYRCGLEALREVDRTVGRVFHEVKRLGELGKTVFIFYTDNGVFLGEHRIRGGKLFPYEEAASTPLMIRVPKRYLHGSRPAGRVSSSVANIDLAPTILRLAQARPCRSHKRCRVLDGRSLVSLIAGQRPPWASGRAIGIELGLKNVNAGHSVCAYAGVRASRQVLVRHSRVKNAAGTKCKRDFEWERYDLRSDPFELHNLCFGGSAGSCPTDARERYMRKLLTKIHRCAGIAGRDPRPRNRYYCD